MNDRKVVWSPQPRQAEFLKRSEYEAFYGGAAGGGKSDALLAEALRQIHIPHYRGIIFRKTFPQLSELIDRSRELYGAVCKSAVFNESKHVWQFPSGAKIYFGTMQHAKDRTNYQGKRYDFIGFDELTHFTFEEYIYLMSRNRPNGPGTRCYIRATGNPGGIGHAWVKNRFITPSPPMTPIDEVVTVRFPDGKERKRKQSRIFVPSSVFDNAKLLENSPEYLSRLAMLPENEKNALLYGDWESFSGQVFAEWVNNPEHYRDRINTHVIDPFFIPEDWKIYRGFDWGYSKPFSVGWYAVDYEGRIYRIRELYGCEGTPDTGVKWTVPQIADKIREIEAEDENLRGRDIYGVADPAIWKADGGVSQAEMFERKGVYFDKADNTRIAGKMQVHYRMQFDDMGHPKLYIFKTCKHFIRTVPTLVYDEVNVEDVDTSQEDHIYDECRYVCMANPIAPTPPKEKTLVVYDPLDSSEYDDFERFGYYYKI